MKLDKSNRLPLYIQLKDALVKMIESRYHPGDMLPAEHELEIMYGVSRMTVRQAMNELVDDGIVIKQQGRGTFVQSPKITHNLTSVTSWTEQMRERNLIPKTIEKELAVIPPPKKIKQQLGMSEDERVVRIKRLRYANDEPMCIMINYIKEKYIPDFSSNEESLYSQLKKDYQLTIYKAREIVEAREASEDEATALRIEPYSPVLFVTRLSFLPDETPFEVVSLTSRADRYQYQIILKT